MYDVRCTMYVHMYDVPCTYICWKYVHMYWRKGYRYLVVGAASTFLNVKSQILVFNHIFSWEKIKY